MAHRALHQSRQHGLQYIFSLHLAEVGVPHLGHPASPVAIADRAILDAAGMHLQQSVQFGSHAHLPPLCRLPQLCCTRLALTASNPGCGISSSPYHPHQRCGSLPEGLQFQHQHCKLGRRQC